MTQQDYSAMITHTLNRYSKKKNKNKRVIGIIDFLKNINSKTILDYENIKEDLWKERYADIDFLKDAIIKTIQNKIK